MKHPNPHHQIIPNQKENFSTKDIGLASILQCEGFRLIGLDSQNPHQVYFCFERGKGLDKTISKHYQNDLKVSSLTLLSNFRNLKNLIHQQK